MKTLDDLRNACVIEVDAQGKEHWIFKGATTRGVPYVKAPDLAFDGKMRKVSAWRFSWQEQNGKACPAHKRMRSVCEHEGCVRCVKDFTRKQLAKMDSKDPVRRAVLQLAALKSWEGRRVITEEIAHDILINGGTAKEAAERNGGIHRYLVHNIRSGRNSISKRVLAPAAGMFSGLIR